MSDSLTLRKAYEKYLWPDVRTLSKATQDGYRITLGDWEAITGDPPVVEIEDATIALYRDELHAKPLARPTVNNRLRCVFAILNRLSPPHPHNRRGLGIIPRAPWARFLKVEKTFPRIASQQELSRIYYACESATWPPRLEFPAADWWRAFLVTLYNTGPRRRDLQGLRTADVDFEAHTLRFTARKTGKLQVIPLNKVALAHLALIRSKRDLVFPMPSGAALFRQWKAIKSVAGIGERLTFQNLRATAGSAFANCVGVEIAGIILGHRVSGVTASFYVNPDAGVRKAVEEIAQPDAFLTIFNRRPDLQNIAKPKPKRRADWSFRPGEAIYQGRVIALPQKLLSCLTMLVTAGRPVPCEHLRKSVWYSKTVSPVTVKTTLIQLRKILKAELRLPADWEPLPNDQTGAGWSLVLPVTEDE